MLRTAGDIGFGCVSLCMHQCMHLELELRNGFYEFHHIGNEYEVGPGHDACLFEI